MAVKEKMETKEYRQKPVVKEKITTPGQLVLRRFMRHKLAITGFVVLIIMLLFSVVGPMLSPYGEYTMFYSNDGVVSSTPSAGADLYNNAFPSSAHPLGTDKDGRDVLTRMMYGGRVSLIIGFLCVFIEVFLGVLLGGIAGYFGKWIDMIIMRLVDVFFCIPMLPVALIIISMVQTLGIAQSMQIYILIGVVGFLGWASVARFVRGQILSLREMEYMLAAEATGLKPFTRIFKHLIPNVIPQLIVIATLNIGGIILFEAALSFLGLGVPYPYASWGNMVNSVTNPTILQNYMHMWIPPGICIILTVVAFNFLGDGLRDAFDPKMKR